MKYAARIFAVFLVLFLISEMAYEMSVSAFAGGQTPEAYDRYEDSLDFGTPRIGGKTVFIFEAGGMEKEVARWMNIPLPEVAGMDERQFAAYLNVFRLPEEMVERGLTKIRLERFRGFDAVISVEEEGNKPRYQYWCKAENGKLRVYDAGRETLVLEQPFVKRRFSLEQIRDLVKGLYLKDYDSLLALLMREP